MSVISKNDVKTAVYVIDKSGAAGLLRDALRASPRGRKLPDNLYRNFLIGAFLSIQRGSFQINDIYKTLTEGIDLDTQFKLGIATPTDKPDKHGRYYTKLTRYQLYRIVDRYKEHLSWTKEAAPELSDQQRHERRDKAMAIGDALLAVTHIVDSTSQMYALDGSGTWAFHRGDRKATHTDTTNPEPDNAYHKERLPTEPTQTTSVDPDGSWGTKTKKNGTQESHFGYEIHALVRIADKPKSEPILIQGIRLTQARADVPTVSLELLDQANTPHHPVKDLAVDRLYSNAVPEKWADELHKRGINQHLDLRVDQHGWSDARGGRMNAGHLHCPQTPNHLEIITRPGPLGSKQDKQAFKEKIAERQQWAAARDHRDPKTGNVRYKCPALDGKLGCPLRHGTVAVATAAGLPIVANPPDPAHAPDMCTNKTVTIPRADHGKLYQKHYWGDEKWSRIYAKRTYVEGVFGNLKNDNRESVNRTVCKIQGLAFRNLVVAMAATSYNIRQLRSWDNHTSQGPNHELLRLKGNTTPPDPDKLYGHSFNTLEQANAIATKHRH